MIIVGQYMDYLQWCTVNVMSIQIGTKPLSLIYVLIKIQFSWPIKMHTQLSAVVGMTKSLAPIINQVLDINTAFWKISNGHKHI